MKWTLTFLMAVISLLSVAALAGTPAASQTKTTFTFDCADPTLLREARLGTIVKRALQASEKGATYAWADRAVLTDLNGDRSPEEVPS